MSRDEREFWNAVRLAGVLLGIVVGVHGITNKSWGQLHSVGLMLTAAATVGPELRRSGLI